MTFPRLNACLVVVKRRWDLAGIAVGDLRSIFRAGWRQVRMRGSHRQFKHPIKAGVVTVSGKANDELAPGTLNSIYKQAGIKK
ncbi:MAG: type II toxin-antitoxin system HicA family toxin [Xanthomonadales bacterium]|jgi:predicted RNA binding protein YcfA (HicA-like mRNA interferase family)|nr:type II toxin-antitoxin system HicA family toxin [Xanthomonadales bacterium]